MNILVGKCFGIGNLVLAVPMLKALKTLTGPDGRLDLLVGNFSDDTGAVDVAHEMLMSNIIDGLYVNSALRIDYDVAIMAIPFDGRWHNDMHFRAKLVMDGRTRPDPKTTGLVSWEKHEVLYQMENVDQLGYSKGVPSPKFIFAPSLPGFDKHRTIYLGLGYKRDDAGFWKFKHWGNEKYTSLVNMLSGARFRVVTTGDMMDLQTTIRPIMEKSPLEYIPTTHLGGAFSVVSSCGYYVGNDTGMMHVAASQGLMTLGIMMDWKLVVKNRPWTPRADLGRCIFGWNDVSPENVLIELTEFIQEVEPCTSSQAVADSSGRTSPIVSCDPARRS